MPIKRKPTEIDLQSIKDAFSGRKQILLLSHYNPDGDAIGSMLALYHYLLKKGHKVAMMVPNDFPDFLKWMKGSEEVMIYFHQQKRVTEFANASDIIVSVDFNEPKRLKDATQILENSKALKILFDHHPNPHPSYSYKVFNTEVSATAELIFEYITAASDQALIDPVIAECIFTGIMSDTGCFNHNSSTPETYKLVSQLLEYEINKDNIFDNFYNNFSESRMRLMGYLLNEKMVVLPEYSTAYITLTREEQSRFHYAPGDTEGFVNLPFSIKGVQIAALFTQKKDHIRISFRSRGGIAINETIAKHFDGGGHQYAAGGESYTDMDKAIKKFVQILAGIKSKIDAAN